MVAGMCVACHIDNLYTSDKCFAFCVLTLRLPSVGNRVLMLVVD